MISARFEGFDSWLEELGAALDTAAASAMDQATVIVANQAASSHRYTNRTGRLQNATVPAGVSGQFLSGSLRGRIEGATQYGSYLEEPGLVTEGVYEGDTGIVASKWAFIFPAYLARKSEIENVFDVTFNVGSF